MTVDIVHALRVACHFWPWERAFWIGLVHDAGEDGWSEWPLVWEYIWFPNIRALDALTRQPGEPYSTYIDRVIAAGGDAIRVKRADLIENYRRGWPSLRKRYAKAMLQIEKAHIITQENPQ